ncbi:DNA repair protein RadC [Cytophagaceae bacterium DM2B3-1]|uniref:DNA repair protein RadC n=2 Tax=Xanthocytophaga TaxID=3078918 RepID=A0ABT7CP00_9BACT|nr:MULTISPECIES: DNA repair protein RadC [Xanthocytophaga]MDJ1466259.1 DNA repair protein RadC [Xanthocytophaga flavus]MDJ1495463.1 DNA repair protein RadC [Xanthocytophaga flavus]MDJ1500379.1 DNA repair protein RadC [Xanthocytophaga agilis]
MIDPISTTKILSWAEEDRPREKLLLKGKAALSDAELIGILLGSGTVSLSAVDLAKQILSSVDNNLTSLAKLSIKDLEKFKGIGEAKAITIVAALELGRRRKDSELPQRQVITSSKDVFTIMHSHLLDLLHEEFWVVLLNRSNVVMKKVQISVGGVSGTVADPKLIFKTALENLASSIILVHNHPSGNLKPSQADKDLTHKLKEAGKYLEIPVLDHVIITEKSYFSFADEGIL